MRTIRFRCFVSKVLRRSYTPQPRVTRLAGLPWVTNENTSPTLKGLNSVRLMLATPEKPEFDHPASVIYYKVADLPAVHTALAARQVEFEAPPHLIAKMPDHDLWMAFLRDSEGNLLGLMSEVSRSKPNA